MQTAICPGSFDPITLGHLDVIRRAAAMFDRVVVGVLHNPEKTGCFPVEKRVEMLKKACRGIPNKELGRFTSQINSLVAKWESWAKKR